ncbi:uncharacterized protein TNCV_3621941 [Trichonephila clavipes]|nr:uncharacterized protein TNCV_3621941 [Trichonephila clavipes]
MALAAAETLSFNNGNPNVPVAIDGTWQKKKKGAILLSMVLLRQLVWTLGKLLMPKYYRGNAHVILTAIYIVMSVRQITFGNSGEWKLKVHFVSSIAQRLTDAEIDKLQRYYGLAIRNNSGNLSAMKQAIWAIFFHKISTDLNPQHGLCPLGDDSWCGYNRSKLKGDTYKHKHNLPIAIMHCIKKKVFRDLSSPELLSRCLHGKTQNCNESLNSVIWSIIPKTVFVHLGTLKTGVYESISIYNQGLITKLKVLDLLNIQPGFYTCRALQEADHARIRKAEKAISRRTKEARIKNRQLKCRQEDDLADDLSNPSYGSGMY